MSRQFTDSQSMDIPAGFKRPNVVLLNSRQWGYLQRRYKITPRELEIAKLVCRGLSNEQIAGHLKIRIGTVKVHMRNIYRKTWVENKILMLLRFIEDSEAFFNEREIVAKDA